MVLSGLTWEICLVYIDDIIVAGKSFDEHLANLTKVFLRLRRANLKLKPSKTKLFQEKVTFFGHVISREWVTPEQDCSCLGVAHS